MTFITADEARERVPAARMARVNEAIEYAIGQGKPLCHVHFSLTDQEERAWRSRGFDVQVETGSTFFYWFPPKEGV